MIKVIWHEVQALAIICLNQKAKKAVKAMSDDQHHGRRIKLVYLVR